VLAREGERVGLSGPRTLIPVSLGPRFGGGFSFWNSIPASRGVELLTRLRCSSGGASFRPSKPYTEAPETPPEPPFAIATLGRGSRLRDEPAETFSGADP